MQNENDHSSLNGVSMILPEFFYCWRLYEKLKSRLYDRQGEAVQHLSQLYPQKTIEKALLILHGIKHHKLI